MFNIGLMWVRNTGATLEVAERVADRTFAAWDQALWNQEVEASTSIRCRADEFDQSAFVDAFELSEDLGNGDKKAPSAQVECASEEEASEQYARQRDALPNQGKDALPPPEGVMPNLYPNWNPLKFNDETERYDTRCQNAPPYGGEGLKVMDAQHQEQRRRRAIKAQKDLEESMLHWKHTQDRIEAATATATGTESRIAREG